MTTTSTPSTEKTTYLEVRVQQEDFDAGVEINRLRQMRPDTGAVATFIGQVRDLNEGDSVSQMTLEHYPGMTEKSLVRILEQASARWPLHAGLVVHRVGELHAMDQIVLVVMTSGHRQAAFEACEFVMDYLKTEAPFWKKESTPNGDRWVEAKASDDNAKARWS